MSIFRKNTALLELVNKFDNMENKIDILNNKFESIRLLDGCCDCQKRENKLCSELKEFIEYKLLNLKESLLISFDNKLIEDKEANVLKNIIEETCNKHAIELNGILEKCTVTHNLKNVDLSSQIKSISDQITQLNEISKQEKKNQDLLLRTDLQEFLIGLQTNINSIISSNQVDIINNYNNTKVNTQEVLDKVVNLSESINNNVKSFFFENEIIKHQFVLEENIQRYNVEIDNIRTLVINAKNSIQETLSKLKGELPELNKDINGYLSDKLF